MHALTSWSRGSLNGRWRSAFLPALPLLLTCCAPSKPPVNSASGPSAEQLIAAAEVEPGGLQAQHRQRLRALANSERCPCQADRRPLARCSVGKGAVAGASRSDGRCWRAPFAIRAILRGVVRGMTDAEIRQRLAQRFDGRLPHRFDLGRIPCRGKTSAPVAVVVFSDFQCPACSYGRRLAEEVVRLAGDRVRVCYKNLPLVTIHPDALLAAQAALAAHRQGRFWPMHDRLFDGQRALQRPHLLAHARALGLDMTRFEADLDSRETRARVVADVAEAERLRVRGTPTFYINGREMTDPMMVPDMLDWVAEELASPKGKPSKTSR